MIALIIIIICVLVVIALYLFCVAPNFGRREQMGLYEQQYYFAHRGLFDNGSDAPENSINAFRLACESKFGIELDVQMTTDEQLVVFHDESLKRMCGADKPLYKCSLAELSQFRLANSHSQIPLLRDVLEIIDGKVPLIVEIKSEGNWKRTTELTAEMLDHYKGSYCMESFSPLVIQWYKKHRPNIIRGQLSTNYTKDHFAFPWIIRFLQTNLLTNFLSRPDFIAYNFKWKNHWSYYLSRKILPAVNVAWTIRNKTDLKKVKGTFDIIIFDSFSPL